jgi:hypothetical protein
MISQTQPTRAQREPRLSTETNATKAKRLAALLPKALKRLATEPPTNARSSAALLAIQARADEILDALKRGYSANAIAVVLADEDGDDATFSAETIRIAIKRLQAEAKPSRPSSQVLARAERPTIFTPPTTNAISRLDEDL